MENLPKSSRENPLIAEEQETSSFEELREQSIEILKQFNLLTEKDGKLFFNTNIEKTELKDIKIRIKRKGHSYRELIKYLDNVYIEDEEEPRPLVTLPRTKEEVLSGNWTKGFFEYQDHANVKWDSSVHTRDNISYSMTEIQILKLLKIQGAYRNEKGQLVYKNEEGSEEKFSLEQASIKTGLRMPKIDDISLLDQPKDFLGLHGQRLLESGILKLEDFSQKSIGSKAENLTYQENMLRGQYARITSHGKYAEYYLGRGKFVGTNIERNENQSLIMLDAENAGIFESKHGGDKRLIAYFKTASADELDNLYLQVKKELEEKGIEESKAPIYAKLKADFMKGRIKEYEPADFCIRKENESDSDYAKRLVRMNDQTYHFEVFRPMMQKAGIKLEEITWENQMKLFGLVLNQKDEGKIINFAKKFGANGISTFLSLESDRSLGDEIIKLSESLPKQETDRIFLKYNELVDQINKIEEILTESYGQSLDKTQIENVKELILKKGKDLLVQFSDLSNRGYGDLSESLINLLDEVEAEAVVFFTVFMTLKKNGRLPDVESIKDISLDVIQGRNIPRDDISRMESIYKNNYKNTNLSEILIQKFRERTKDSQTRFYFLKHSGKVRAFAGFTQKESYIHLNSVNVDKSVRGLSIGETLISRAIEQNAKENIIKAECLISAPISNYYIENGFVADGYLDIVGNPCFEITRNDQEKFLTKSSGKTKDEFIKEVLETELKNNENIYKSENYFTVKAENPEDIDFQTYFSEGNVLTRYFTYKTGEKTFWYAVFEPKSELHIKELEEINEQSILNEAA